MVAYGSNIGFYRGQATQKLWALSRDVRAIALPRASAKRIFLGRNEIAGYRGKES